MAVYDSTRGVLAGADLVGGLLRQGQQVQGFLSDQYDQAARRKAGGLLSDGDTAGAVGVLAGRGLLSEAAPYQKMATSQKVLQQANAGDWKGARSAAAEAGDTGLYSAAQEGEAAERKERAAWLGNAADALLQVAPEKRAEAFQQFVAPTMRAMGMGDDVLAQITPDTLSDEGLKTFKASLGEADALDIQKLEDGSLVGVNKRTGDVRVLHKGTGAKVVGNALVAADGRVLYRAPETTKLGEGDTLYETAPGVEGGGLSQFREAIASIESAGSGDYSAQGPVTRSGDRAYGRYQVMGNNIPEWTEAALGQRLTPEQFLASPQAQDAVFDHRFGQYIEQYGSPEEAASVWFTGQPMSRGADRRDVLGTSGSDYVSKFRQALGGGDVQPYEVASVGDTPPPPSGRGTPRVLATGRAKPTAQILSPAEIAAAGLAPGTVAQRKADGTIDVVQKAEDATKANKVEQARETQILKARDLIAAVREARGNVKPGTAGFGSGKLSEIRGTGAYDLERQIDTIKANLGFQELQAMREASPTGGALGAIAVQELVALQSTVASLDAGQSPGQLKANLKKVEDHYQRWLDTVQPQAAAVEKPRVPDAARATRANLQQSGRLDPKKPLGSQANPYVARDEATANRLPKGSFVIMPNGDLGQVE